MMARVVSDTGAIRFGGRKSQDRESARARFAEVASRSATTIYRFVRLKDDIGVVVTLAS